jgi:hypothetical protein
MRPVQQLFPISAATHNGVQTSESSTDSQTSETGLCDGGIDNPLGAETVQKTPRHLVTRRSQ